MDYLPKISFLNPKVLSDIKMFCHDYTLADNRPLVIVCASLDNLPIIADIYSKDFAEKIMQATLEKIEAILKQEFCKNFIIRQIGKNLISFVMPKPVETINSTRLNCKKDIFYNIKKSLTLYRNSSFNQEVCLSISIGYTDLPYNTQNIQTALNKSFLATMEVALKEGKSSMNYRDIKEEYKKSNLGLRKIFDIKDAFKENRICLAMQPVVDRASKQIAFYECLLRIVDMNGKVSSAGTSIPLAEKLGLIDVIDGFVAENIFKELLEDKNLCLSFNLSNLTTEDEKWLTSFKELAKEHSGVTSRIIVEITETAPDRDIKQTEDFIKIMQAMGCKVALDDFGTGYTSFRQLRNLSVDIIKIDGSYIRNIEKDSENYLFIKTLIEFAKNLGMKIVAEFVETESEALIMSDLKTDYLQGYYYGKPCVKNETLNKIIYNIKSNKDEKII